MKNCINLTTSEVQAILAGATLIARPLNPQPTYLGGDIVTDLGAGEYTSTVTDKYGEEDAGPEVFGAISESAEWCWKAPFQPGQTVYGREKWHDESAEGEKRWFVHQSTSPDWVMPSGCHWMSAATMPREASRIFLRIESVDVKRCQDVTEDEAKRMGAPKMHLDDLGNTFMTHQRGFESRYTARHGAAAWEANQWVWLYSVTRVESL